MALPGLLWAILSGAAGLLLLVGLLFWVSQRWGKLNGPAHGFAALRTIGAQEEDVLVKCQDDLACLFAPSFVGANALRKFGARYVYPGLYESVLALTRVSDNVFCELVKQNHFKGDPNKRIQQIVVLGADYGTRLIRFNQLLKDRGIKAFEVDWFGYQQSKLKVLKAAEKALKDGMYSNEGIHYSESTVDELGSLQQSLGSSFQASKPTLWILEGVTPFLTAALVDTVLAAILKISGENGCVICDIVPKLPQLTESTDAEAYLNTEQAILALRSLFPNSPGQFELQMSQARKWCEARGFDLMRAMGPQALQVPLLRVDGSVVGQVPDCLRLFVLEASSAAKPSQEADEPAATTNTARKQKAKA